MKWLCGAAALLLAACAGPQQAEVRTVPEAGLLPFLQAHAHKSQLEGAFAPEKRVVFDTGYEAWLYHVPTAGGPAELVVLVGPDGTVRKWRQRPPATPPAPGGRES
ncbi:MAG: hypothetical protein ACXU8N_04955 [Telluria sp.]